ncbi:MAG: MFS transporter [Deltaproteobacteria bacterium]|nr:MFS transporter [Deltaproteobacteria bacterium]
MRTFLLLIFWGLWFLNFSSRTVFSPILPILEQELHLTHARAGSLFLFLSVGYTSTLLLAGSLAPRVGYKRTITAGFLAVTIAHLFLGQARSYWSLASFFFLVGISTGIYMPSIIPIITATFDRAKWGKVIALHDTAASTSIFLIPILAAVCIRYFSWRALFPVLSGACLAGALLFWSFSPDPRARDRAGSGFLHVFRRPVFWRMAVLWIFAAASNMGLYSIIPLFLVRERGIPIELANTVFGASRVGGIFVSILAGFMADRYGARRILALAFLITGASTIGVALAWNFPLLVGMLFLQASVSLGFFPVALLGISKLTTFEERSAFTGGSLALGVVFGLGVTPVLLGSAADLWNFETGILALGILTVISTLSLRGLKGI